MNRMHWKVAYTHRLGRSYKQNKSCIRSKSKDSLKVTKSCLKQYKKRRVQVLCKEKSVSVYFRSGGEFQCCKPQKSYLSKSGDIVLKHYFGSSESHLNST